MTCNWWAEDDDSKLGGMCWYWDDCRDCSGSKDNTCYNIVEKRRYDIGLDAMDVV